MDYWDEKKYKQAKAAYEKAQRESEVAIEEAYHDYYDVIYSLIERLNRDLNEDCKTLTLKPFDDEPVKDFTVQLIDWLEKDIDLAQQWQTDQQQQETRLYDEMHNFIIYAQKLIEKLANNDRTKLPEIIYTFRTMPLVKYGHIWAHKQEITQQAYALSADKAIGLINWVHAVHGIYHAAINEIVKENNYQNTRLYNVKKEWVIRLEKLKHKMLFRKQVVDNH